MSRLDLVDEFLRSGVDDPRTVGVTHELIDVGQGLGFIESQGNSVAIRTADGIVLVDVGMPQAGPKIVDALRTWSQAPISHVVYTHGHLDHVGGGGAVRADADARGEELPEVIAHTALSRRLDRYRRTDARNLRINQVQFRGRLDLADGKAPLELKPPFLPESVLEPTRTYDSKDVIEPDGERIELIHHRGETDDATWLWLPERGAICTGDLWLWVFPNAGNPQKAMRHPTDWARALRQMVSLNPELLLPGHGLPIRGTEQIAAALNHVAEGLEFLVEHAVQLINEGATLDEVLHRVVLPESYLTKPWSRPVYDDPEFILHNIWREYAGWWDGRPAELKPAPAAALARELISMAGGSSSVLRRAEELHDRGELRLASHLVDAALEAGEESEATHVLRERIYRARFEEEGSEMARGIFLDAASRSRDWLATHAKD